MDLSHGNEQVLGETSFQINIAGVDHICSLLSLVSGANLTYTEFPTEWHLGRESTPHCFVTVPHNLHTWFSEIFSMQHLASAFNKNSIYYQELSLLPLKTV